MSCDKISGIFVICAGGFDLGEINGLELNTTTWKVTHLHVKLSKAASEDSWIQKKIQKLNCLRAYQFYMKFAIKFVDYKSIQQTKQKTSH